MLENLSKVLNSIITPPEKQLTSPEIHITSYSFAESFTSSLRQKDNLSEETVDKVGLLFATNLYMTALTIGIPKNSYNLRVEQVVYSSNAIIQYFKELETILNIVPIYLSDIINKVVQGVKDLTSFSNSVNDFVDFTYSIQYYLKIIELERQFVPKEFNIPDVQSQFQPFLNNTIQSLKEVDKYRAMQEQNYPTNDLKQQEAIYVTSIKEVSEMIVKNKQFLLNAQKKISEQFNSLFSERSYFESFEYFTKFINTISSITMHSYKIMQYDPAEFLNGILNLQNILTGTFTTITAYYMAMRSRVTLAGCQEQSRKSYKILGPYVDSLSALLSKTIPKCPPFLYEYLRTRFIELFTEIQRLYVDYDRQTAQLSSIIENGSSPQNQPETQPQIQSQTQQQTQPQTQQQTQPQTQQQTQSQTHSQNSTAGVGESHLNEKVLKLQEENEKLVKELERVKSENLSLREKLSKSGDTKKDKKEGGAVRSRTIKPVSVDEIDNMKNKTLIGQGGQSRVYRVSKDSFFALKELEVTSSISENYEHLRRLLQEYEIINTLVHPNIIKTYGICFGDDTHPPSIILEFCPFNLSKCVKDLQDCERISVIFEISSAMSEVHEKHLIHRDLKPENILLDDEKHVKISDFGISRLNEIEGENSKTLGIGTLKFMAPEILNEDKYYTEKVDVYSFGVILFFVLTNGQYPKISISEIATGKKATIPAHVNQVSRELILRCWSTKSDDRPSFNEIVEYITDNNFKLIDGIEYQVPKIKEFLSL